MIYSLKGMYRALNSNSYTEACKGIRICWGLFHNADECRIDFPTVHQSLSNMFLSHIQTNACSKFDMVSFKRFNTALCPAQRVTAVYFRTNSSCFFYCALLPGGVIMDGAGTLLFYQSSKYRPAQQKCINTALWTLSRASCTMSGCFLLWSVCPGSAAVYSLHMHIDIYWFF